MPFQLAQQLVRRDKPRNDHPVEEWPLTAPEQERCPLHRCPLHSLGRSPVGSRPGQRFHHPCPRDLRGVEGNRVDLRFPHVVSGNVKRDRVISLALWMRDAVFSPRPLHLGERKGRRVHAVAKPGRLRPVLEHVPQVGIAPCAKHLDPFREPTRIVLGADILLGDRGEKAGPSRSGFVLGLRSEQARFAAHAPVDPLLVMFIVLAGKRPFRSLLPGDPELFGGKPSTEPATPSPSC